MFYEAAIPETGVLAPPKSLEKALASPAALRRRRARPFGAWGNASPFRLSAGFLTRGPLCVGGRGGWPGPGLRNCAARRRLGSAACAPRAGSSGTDSGDVLQLAADKSGQHPWSHCKSNDVWKVMWKNKRNKNIFKKEIRKKLVLQWPH